MSREVPEGPHERTVGRALHWTDTASRDELEDYCRHAEDDLRAQAAELDHLRAENEALRNRLAWIEARAAGAVSTEYGMACALDHIQREAAAMTPNASLSGGRRPSD